MKAILIFIAFFLNLNGEPVYYYITPVDEGGVCDTGDTLLEPCLPLTNYTPDMLTNKSHRINITMLFLPGNYSVTSRYELLSQNVDTLLMLPLHNDSSGVNITCSLGGTMRMRFDNLATLKIHSLKISSCTLDRFLISVVNVHHYFEVYDCFFYNNSMLGMSDNIVSLSTISDPKVIISKSHFTKNRLPLIRISSSSESQRRLSFLLDHCTFAHNYNTFAFYQHDFLFVENANGTELNNCSFVNNTVYSATGTRGTLVFVKSSINLLIRKSAFSNNVANSPGVVSTTFDPINITITDSYFIQNRINQRINMPHHNKIVHLHCGDPNATVYINNCTFDSNLAYEGSGALFILNCGMVQIDNGNFSKNQVISGHGGAANVINQHILHIKKSCFVDNRAQFSGGAISTNGNSTVSDCIFTGNGAGEDGGAMEFSPPGNYNATISNCTFEGNFANRSGGAFYGSGWTELNNCFFFNNTAISEHGGAAYMSGSNSIYLSHFCDNKANLSGGAISVYNNSHIFNCTFMRNDVSSGHGGALFAAGISQQTITVNFSINACMNNKALFGGALYISASNVIISSFNLTDNTATESGGAIYAERSSVTTRHDQERPTSIDYNTAGRSGGGVTLTGGSQLELNLRSSIHFSHNNVTAEDGTGGAIHVPTNCSVMNDTCPIYVQSYTDYVNNTGRYLHFADNHAARGSILFGGQLDRCSILPQRDHNITFLGNHEILKLLTATEDVYSHHSYAITSDIVGLCFCENYSTNCDLREKNISRYHNQLIVVSVATVNQMHRFLPSNISSHYTDPEFANRNTSWPSLSSDCNELKFYANSRIKLKHMAIILEANTSCRHQNKLRINVKITGCPVGFQESEVRCDCDQRLLMLVESCDINYQTVKTRSAGWFAYDETYLRINKRCPLDYCTKENSNNISTLFPDKQCANNRGGVLCGGCKENHSIVVGSWRCLECTHSRFNFIWLVLVMATAGVVLVIFLLLFKLTVSSGTMNGLIFYANVVTVGGLINLPDCSINPLLTVFISWINLDFGIETCFYSGMDTYQKTWLQFAFPIYIWLLVGIIIIACHYSSRAMKLMGRINIDMLATLFLLSYAKLLKTVISAFSFVEIMIAKAHNIADPLVPHKVWTYDGNVDYLSGKHLPLFVVALFFLVFLFLPYTLLLTFGQCLRSLPRKRGLRWVRSTAFISIMDAYHAPYNRRHRYWTGLTLLTRCVLFTIFAANTYNVLVTNMFTTVITTTLLLVTRSFLASTIYKNWFVDKLELTFLLNLDFLAATLCYLEAIEASDASCGVITSSTALVFVMFISIILYHLYLRAKETETYKKVISKLVISRHTPETVVVLADTDAQSQKPHTTTFLNLRETLLDNKD